MIYTFGDEMHANARWYTIAFAMDKKIRQVETCRIFWRRRRDWLLTDAIEMKRFELYSKRASKGFAFWRFALCCENRNARGAIGACRPCASTDALTLDHLRRLTAWAWAQSQISTSENKRDTRNGYPFCLANNYNFDTSHHLNDRLNFFKKFNVSFVAPAVSEYPFLFSNRVKGPM